MASSALKLLAQKAKKRLTSAGQSLAEQQSLDKTSFAYLASGSYAIVASRQSLKDDPLFEKVKKIVNSGEIQNPLAILTDKSVFDSLDGADKERYIIDISKRYNKIKDYLLSCEK